MSNQTNRTHDEEIHLAAGPAAMSTDALVRRVQQYLAGTGVIRAILFGSYARGEADAASDLDLILIEETSLPFLERGRQHLPLFRLGPGVDLLVYTPQEFDELTRQGNPLLKQATAEGITVHARSAS
jgi:uncharacterized protein